MEEEKINYRNYVWFCLNFLLRTISWIRGLLLWIGYMDVFSLIIITSITFVYFTVIQLIVDMIKKKAIHREDDLIDFMITKLSVVLIGWVLPFLPFNPISIMIFILSNLGIIIALGIFFSKFALKKKRNFNIYLVSSTIIFLLAFITFDLIFFLLLCVVGTVPIIVINKEYKVWQRFNKDQKRLLKIMMGALIFLIIFTIITRIFFL